MEFPTKVRIDNEVVAAYIPIGVIDESERAGIVDHTETCPAEKGMLNLDYDKDGMVVGIELVGFKLRPF